MALAGSPQSFRSSAAGSDRSSLTASVFGSAGETPVTSVSSVVLNRVLSSVLRLIEVHIGITSATWMNRISGTLNIAYTVRHVYCL